MNAEICSSSPERPGELVCRADYAPDGVVTAVTVTRADLWVLVSRDFVTRLVDGGLATANGQVLTVGHPEKVTYRRVRRLNETTDLFTRVPDVDAGLAAALRKSVDAVASPARPYAAQDAAWELARQTRAQNVNAVQDDALVEITRQAQRSAVRVDELQAVLNEVLSYFGEKGHPGYEAIRTWWVRAEKLAEWCRVAAGRPSFDELVEQLADVTLTDWQREHLREVWDYREAHGRWPSVIHSGRRNGLATEREALRQLIELASRYA